MISSGGHSESPPEYSRNQFSRSLPHPHTYDLQGMSRLRTRLTKVQQTLGVSKQQSDGTP